MTQLPSGEDGSSRPKKPAERSMEKCDFCRGRKIKCYPVDRDWSKGQKCVSSSIPLESLIISRRPPLLEQIGDSTFERTHFPVSQFHDYEEATTVLNKRGQLFMLIALCRILANSMINLVDLMSESGQSHTDQKQQLMVRHQEQTAPGVATAMYVPRLPLSPSRPLTE